MIKKISTFGCLVMCVVLAMSCRQRANSDISDDLSDEDRKKFKDFTAAMECVGQKDSRWYFFSYRDYGLGFKALVIESHSENDFSKPRQLEEDFSFIPAMMLAAKLQIGEYYDSDKNQFKNHLQISADFASANYFREQTKVFENLKCDTKRHILNDRLNLAASALKAQLVTKFGLSPKARLGLAQCSDQWHRVITGEVKKENDTPGGYGLVIEIKKPEEALAFSKAVLEDAKPNNTIPGFHMTDFLGGDEKLKQFSYYPFCLPIQ